MPARTITIPHDPPPLVREMPALVVQDWPDATADLPLPFLQEQVGGFFEVIKFGVVGSDEVLMLLNEDGQSLRLPENRRARQLLAHQYGTTTAAIRPLLGDVLLVRTAGTRMPALHGSVADHIAGFIAGTTGLITWKETPWPPK